MHCRIRLFSLCMISLHGVKVDYVTIHMICGDVVSSCFTVCLTLCCCQHSDDHWSVQHGRPGASCPRGESLEVVFRSAENGDGKREGGPRNSVFSALRESSSMAVYVAFGSTCWEYILGLLV